ncbi:initiator tRNA phosphoribosyl transferase [Marasmius fiardii PR-910]|nr:initiator tRNA phosphoribosyl transferase [Marasmius fiardii PR-910]
MGSHLDHDHSKHDLHLNDHNFNFKALQIGAFSHLRKESFDLYNRLHSIEEDVKFVEQVHETYPKIPLIPNLRCGAWYCDPAISAPYPAYFKSTDGHTSNWKFNLRRPNLHLLPVISEAGGIILVDSTRAGKRIPDSLSKTVPIWCAVINRAVVSRFPELCMEDTGNGNWDTVLHTPPLAVSKQEHKQIESLLDEWAEGLIKSSYALPKLPKPIRPIWITPTSSSFPQLNDVDFLPVICVSASRYVEGVDRRSGGFVYVQGSGDDHEMWGKGLTPQAYWAHHDLLFSADRSDVEEKVVSIVKIQDGLRDSIATLPSKITKVGGRLQISTLHDVSSRHQDTEELLAHILISNNASEWPDMNMDTNIDEKSLILRILSPEGKKGQTHFLQVVLPRSVEFVGSQLSRGFSVCVSCPTGNDVSVGVAVVALQRFFDGNGDPVLDGGDRIDFTQKDKSTIRTRLEWIISDRPTANPSRNTLKRVNEYLLCSPAFRMSSPAGTKKR